MPWSQLHRAGLFHKKEMAVGPKEKNFFTGSILGVLSVIYARNNRRNLAFDVVHDFAVSPVLGSPVYCVCLTRLLFWSLLNY
jgi:hypothetical protein